MHQAVFENDEEKDREYLDQSEDDSIVLYSDSEVIAEDSDAQLGQLDRQVRFLQVAKNQTAQNRKTVEEV